MDRKLKRAQQKRCNIDLELFDGYTFIGGIPSFTRNSKQEGERIN